MELSYLEVLMILPRKKSNHLHHPARISQLGLEFASPVRKQAKGSTHAVDSAIQFSEGRAWRTAG